MGLNPIDEDGYWPNSLLLHALYELPNVHLLCDDMLAVQQHSYSGVGGVCFQRAMLTVPLHVLCWGAEEAISLRVQATCSSSLNQKLS